MPDRPSPQAQARPAAAPAAPAAAATPAPEPRLPPYRPVSRSRVWLIVALTVATVVLIAVEMLRPHMQLMNAKAARADAAHLAACPPGAASAAPGCPGSRLQVLVLPAGSSR